MYNDHLPQEEARELIEQRRREVETYSFQKQLGFGDSGGSRWILLLIIVALVVVVGALL